MCRSVGHTEKLERESFMSVDITGLQFHYETSQASLLGVTTLYNLDIFEIHL